MSDTAKLLQQLQSGQISLEECQSKMEASASANKVKEEKKLHFKVTEKGCVGIYGLRRMPFTFYIGELEKILGTILNEWDYSKEFQTFLDEAGDSLTRK